MSGSKNFYVPIGDTEFVGGVKLNNLELSNQQFFDVLMPRYASFTLPVLENKVPSHLLIKVYSDKKLKNVEKTIDTEKNIEDRKIVFGINSSGFFQIPDNGFEDSYQGNPVFVDLQEFHDEIHYISWEYLGEVYYSIFPSINIDNYGNGKAISGGDSGEGGGANSIRIEKVYYNKIIVPSDYIPIMIKTNKETFYNIRGEDISLSEDGNVFYIDISNVLALNNLSKFNSYWYVYFGGKTSFSVYKTPFMILIKENPVNIYGKQEKEIKETTLEAISTNGESISYKHYSGTIPEGIELRENGEISGTPVGYGNFNAKISANCQDKSSLIDVNFNIQQKIKVTGTSEYTIEGLVGDYISDYLMLDATSNDGNKVEFSVMDGYKLPEDVSLEGKYISCFKKFTEEFKEEIKILAYCETAEENLIITLKFNIRERVVVQGDYNYIINGFIGQPINVELKATSTDGNPVKFVVEDGYKLPKGIYLSEDGLVYGASEEYALSVAYVIASGEAVDEPLYITLNFNIENNKVQGDYNYIINGLFGEEISVKLEATSTNGNPVTFELESGTLPKDIYLSEDGLISGTYNQTSITHTSYIKAISKDAEPLMITVKFNIKHKIIGTTEYTIKGYMDGGSEPLELDAKSTDGNPVTFSLEKGRLPNGITLSEDGIISGADSFPSGINSTVEIKATSTNAEPLIIVVNFNIIANVDSSPIATIDGYTTYGQTGIELDSNMKFILADELDEYLNPTCTHKLRFQVNHDSSLPDGLSMDEDGLITGTPTTPGEFETKIRISCDKESGHLIYIMHFNITD